MRTTAAVLHDDGATAGAGGLRSLVLEELDLEAPRVGELLVRVDAAGVCHSDLSVVDGSRRRPTPMALGHEATGIVERVGQGVRDVRQGDRVVLVFLPGCGRCAHCGSGLAHLCRPSADANAAGELLGGGRRLRREGVPVHHHLGISAFSTHAVVDRRSAVVVPVEVPPAVAALFGCAVLTGVGAVVNTARVRPGAAVGVFGLGGVGLCALLGAVLAGAHPVIAVDPVPAKRSLALELGATTAVAPEDAAGVVGALPSGGVDIAFEAAGKASVLQAAYDGTAPGGTVVAVGLPHPAEELRIPAVSLVATGRTLRGSYMGSSVPERDIPRYLGLWRAGRLPVERLVSAVRPLSDVNPALQELASGAALRQILVP